MSSVELKCWASDKITFVLIALSTLDSSLMKHEKGKLKYREREKEIEKERKRKIRKGKGRV